MAVHRDTGAAEMRHKELVVLGGLAMFIAIVSTLACFGWRL